MTGYRRYDPGMALNEATKRAIEAKAEDRLTAGQKMALEFQRKYLNDVVRKS